MLVILSKRAAKHYNSLPKREQQKLKKKLLELESNPFCGKKLSGEFEGNRSLKVWPYRIIYIIDEKKEQVEVRDILHRQGAYN